MAVLLVASACTMSSDETPSSSTVASPSATSTEMPTTTTSLPEGTFGATIPFDPPKAVVTDTFVQYDLTLVDGSRIALSLPRVLADEITGFVPVGGANLDGHSRVLDVYHGSITEMFRDLRPLATYRDALGNLVPYYSFAGMTANGMASQFGSWVVLLWDEDPAVEEPSSDADRMRFASLLSGHETEDGYLVLDPVEPMTVGSLNGSVGVLRGEAGSDVLVSIVRGDVAQTRCSVAEQTTEGGYGVAPSPFLTGLDVCTPDHEVLLSIWGPFLSQDALDTIKVAEPPAVSTGHDCATDTSGRVDPLDPNGMLAVYFSCRGDTPLTFYVPTTGRPIGKISTDVASQLDEVIRLYADGPTAEEQVNGYGAFAGLQLPINSVSLIGGRAIIDFGAGITDINGLGTSSFDGIVLSELQANVFQFPDIDELELDIEGDCERFGAMMEYGRCLVLTRAEWEAQSAS
jgi:hypothetical protein